MPATFAKASEEVESLGKALAINYHLDLESARVKIDYVFAFRDPETEEPALMQKGHRVLGVPSIVNLKNRAKGMGDCEVVLDGDAWNDMTEDQRKAILDHELEHFEVKREKKTGDFLFDDLMRPLLRLRNHDREFGFFDNIASRHGNGSFEIQGLRKMFSEAGGAYLPHLRNQLPDSMTAKGQSVRVYALSDPPKDEPAEDPPDEGATVTVKRGLLSKLAEKHAAQEKHDQ